MFCFHSLDKIRHCCDRTSVRFRMNLFYLCASISKIIYIFYHINLNVFWDELTAAETYLFVSSISEMTEYAHFNANIIIRNDNKKAL